MFELHNIEAREVFNRLINDIRNSGNIPVVDLNEEDGSWCIEEYVPYKENMKRRHLSEHWKDS